MKTLEINGLEDLSKEDQFLINGGEAGDALYWIGYGWGKFIRGLEYLDNVLEGNEP